MTNERSAANRLRFKRASWIQAVVFFQDGSEFFVIEGDNFVIFDSGHRFGGDHCVHDGFFDRLHRSSENGVQFAIRKHFEIRDFLFFARTNVRGGKRNENISRTVAGNTSVAAEAKRNAPRETLQLMRQKRRIGRNHDEDRKSTRLNSSHLVISYAVFCLKKKQ